MEKVALGVDKQLAVEKIIPVIKLDNASDVLPLADALNKGGIRVAEVTFRTAVAATAIRLLRKNRPAMLVGAGTILTIDQLSAAVDSGASFVVTPGFNPRIVEGALERKIPIFPGVNNPSHIEIAMSYGLKILKFFPAELSGGIPMLKTLGAVYSVAFIPTGGLDADNIQGYLRLPNVCACGGSWMVKAEYINSGNFNKIAELSVAAKAIIEDRQNEEPRKELL